MTDSNNAPRRPLTPVFFLLGLFATAAGALVGAGGCGGKPPQISKDADDKSGGPKVDPWVTAGQKLKKETDSNAVRLALAGLASDLNAQNKEALPVLSEDAVTKLAELVPLAPADRDEVRSATFTPHDGVYLADCLYLRDVARSLALSGAPADYQAEVAFAWVCRQVYLQPWVRQFDAQTFATTALPPTAVLRRGFGSGLERAYVFLALLQQLDLDAVLVGKKDAGAVSITFQVNVPVTTPAALANVVAAAPRGPFWAVGVRVGNDIRLYDPWRSTSLPFTLNKLRSDPEPLKAWFDDPANAGGAKLADAKDSATYLAVPVNALAPRMATVGTRLRNELDAKLAFNPAALRAAFPDPKPSFWNPPEEPFTYGRAARSLLPFDQGGSDRGQPGTRIYDAYRRDQLPPAVFRVPDALAPVPARNRLGGTAASALGLSFIEPPNPRERIQRGQFQDASKDLVIKQDAFTGGLERQRLNKDADQQIREWIESINGVYEELGRAQLNNNKDAEAAYTRQIDVLWQQAGALYLVDRASAEMGLAEAMLLLALCKHELAERAQVRVERETGPGAGRLRQSASDAWKTALSAWRTYEGLAGAQSGFPGRAAHAQALATRAERFATQAQPK